ncbi:hypothetical protein GJC41_18600 [Salmonella enterica]|nr:hypothetical protein [Salmonella enterica]
MYPGPLSAEGYFERMKSQRGRSARLAHTETTGLDAGAQALEIGLVNVRGERLFETRLKPTVNIDSISKLTPTFSRRLTGFREAAPATGQRTFATLNKPDLFSLIYSINANVRIH